jgi:SpoVK/Ycf46/Vps4 family AAA+-type ATPase
LQTGEKVSVPFAITILFSTNLEPRDLMQEAFMRRIPYKVMIPPPMPAEFREILRIQCKNKKVIFDEESVEHVIKKVYNQKTVTPRSCLPRDIVEIVVANARYDGKEPVLNRDSFELAWHLAFPEGS